MPVGFFVEVLEEDCDLVNAEAEAPSRVPVVADVLFVQLTDFWQMLFIVCKREVLYRFHRYHGFLFDLLFAAGVNRALRSYICLGCGHSLIYYLLKGTNFSFCHVPHLGRICIEKWHSWWLMLRNDASEASELHRGHSAWVGIDALKGYQLSALRRLYGWRAGGPTRRIEMHGMRRFYSNSFYWLTLFHWKAFLLKLIL